MLSDPSRALPSLPVTRTGTVSVYTPSLNVRGTSAVIVIGTPVSFVQNIGAAGSLISVIQLKLGGCSNASVYCVDELKMVGVIRKVWLKTSPGSSATVW